MRNKEERKCKKKGILGFVCEFIGEGMGWL